jgi:ATP-dependent protease ClpP protease subunit
MPTTYVNFHAGINQNTTQNLMTVVSQKIVAGTTDFYILLSTPGGDVASGITVYNFLRSIPANVTMHNIGNVDSIGNAIFLAANTRRACAHSTFMFHGVGLDVKNLRVEEKNARELLHGILANQSRIADIIVDRTNIDRRRSRQLFREARTKDANEALAGGIIHQIADPAIPAGADIVSFVFNP